MVRRIALIVLALLAACSFAADHEISLTTQDGLAQARSEVPDLDAKVKRFGDLAARAFPLIPDLSGSVDVAHPKLLEVGTAGIWLKDGPCQVYLSGDGFVFMAAENAFNQGLDATRQPENTPDLPSLAEQAFQAFVGDLPGRDLSLGPSSPGRGSFYYYRSTLGVRHAVPECAVHLNPVTGRLLEVRYSGTPALCDPWTRLVDQDAATDAALTALKSFAGWESAEIDRVKLQVESLQQPSAGPSDYTEELVSLAEARKQIPLYEVWLRSPTPGPDPRAVEMGFGWYFRGWSAEQVRNGESRASYLVLVDARNGRPFLILFNWLQHPSMWRGEGKPLPALKPVAWPKAGRVALALRAGGFTTDARMAPAPKPGAQPKDAKPVWVYRGGNAYLASLEPSTRTLTLKADGKVLAMVVPESFAKAARQSKPPKAPTFAFKRPAK